MKHPDASLAGMAGHGAKNATHRIGAEMGLDLENHIRSQFK